jgi:hypothetical protein
MRFILALFRSVVERFGDSNVRAPQNLLVTCPCDPEALPIIARELRSFGARVTFERQWAGLVMSEAGTLFFRYNEGTLTIAVVEDRGHFARNLMIGGIKQTVEEANEEARRINRALVVEERVGA